MSATRKSAGSAKSTGPAKSARKATARKASTRKAARKGTSTRRRRTTATRRTQPKVATTVGAALGTLVVSLLLDASWPVRIGLVLLALVLVGGYLFVQGRRHDALAPAEPEPTPLADSTPTVDPATPAPSTPSAPTPKDTL